MGAVTTNSLRIWWATRSDKFIKRNARPLLIYLQQLLLPTDFTSQLSINWWFGLVVWGLGSGPIIEPQTNLSHPWATGAPNEVQEGEKQRPKILAVWESAMERSEVRLQRTSRKKQKGAAKFRLADLGQKAREPAPSCD